MSDDKPIHLLLVGCDDAVYVAALHGRFEPADIWLHVVSDGAAALEVLHRRGEHTGAPQIELVVLDLPDAASKEALGAIKGEPGLLFVPVVVFLADAADRGYPDHYDLGAAARIPGRADPAYLSRLTRRLVDRYRREPSPQYLRAKELYFMHEASLFYLSRGSHEARFNSYHVAREVREAWDNEYLAEQLAELQTNGLNLATVAFLERPGHTQYLPDVVAAPMPNHGLQDQLICLRTLAEYIEECTPHHPPAAVAAAWERLAADAQRLLPRSRSDKTRTQLNELIVRAAPAADDGTGDGAL